MEPQYFECGLRPSSWQTFIFIANNPVRTFTYSCMVHRLHSFGDMWSKIHCLAYTIWSVCSNEYSFFLCARTCTCTWMLLYIYIYVQFRKSPVTFTASQLYQLKVALYTNTEYVIVPPTRSAVGQCPSLHLNDAFQALLPPVCWWIGLSLCLFVCLSNIDEHRRYFSKFTIAIGKWSNIYIEGCLCKHDLSFSRMH